MCEITEQYFEKICGSLSASGQLHTYPSPKPTTENWWPVGVKVGLGEGRGGVRVQLLMYWFVIIPGFCYTEPVNKNNNKTVIAINTYCLNKSQQQQYSHLHVSHHQIQWPFLVQLHPSSTLLELAFPLERQIKNDLTFYAKSNCRWEYATKHQHSWPHYHKNTNCCCVQDQKHAQVVVF